jgi:hypothetical protein
MLAAVTAMPKGNEGKGPDESASQSMVGHQVVQLHGCF